MARRKRKDAESVSLFPFMSILVCVIGILVLMISAMALAQIGKDQVQAEDAAEEARQQAEAEARIEKYRELQARIVADRARAGRLEQLLADSAAAREKLETARQELARLESERHAATEKAQQQDQELARRQAEADRLMKLIEQLEQEMLTVQAAIDKLKAELADRNQPPEEAQVVIQPSGSAEELKPTFVECAASSVVLLDRDEPQRVPRGQLAQNEDFARVLEQVRQRPDATVIFLVRPDGIDTYNTARNIARSRYVRNGKLAISTQGKIDLTQYQNK